MESSPKAVVFGVIGAVGAIFGLAGCGPAPYVIGPDDPPVTVEVAAPLPPAERADDPADRWLPERYPRPNPFVGKRIWSGAYDCPQGRTDLVLEVTDVHDNWVRAIFDFHHGPSRAAGRYYVAGNFDPRTGVVSLVPGPWIEKPEGYVAVGMEGQMSPEGKLISGKITHPDCGGFRIQPMRHR